MGAKVLEKLSKDLISSFPEASGFSFRNLKYMRQFAESYPNDIWETAVAQIPWGHNIILIQKVKNHSERLWYATQAIDHGWSRTMLLNWIESDLYSRQGKAITNFKKTLPKPQSDLAEQTLKDPYNFSFLTLEGVLRECSSLKRLLWKISSLPCFKSPIWAFCIGRLELFSYKTLPE